MSHGLKVGNFRKSIFKLKQIVKFDTLCDKLKRPRRIALIFLIQVVILREAHGPLKCLAIWKLRRKSEINNIKRALAKQLLTDFLVPMKKIFLAFCLLPVLSSAQNFHFAGQSWTGQLSRRS